jgi:hypothetical protein
LTKRIHDSRAKDSYSEVYIMSSSNRTSTTWRQREKEKERIQMEQIALEKEKAFAKTETNFPTTISSTVRKVIAEGPDLAARILEAHIQEEVRKQVAQHYAAVQERERQAILHGVYLDPSRRSRKRRFEEDDESVAPRPLSLREQFPSHGRRGYSTDPDSEGWREVIKRVRRIRVLTNAELERLASLSNEDEEEVEERNAEWSRS